MPDETCKETFCGTYVEDFSNKMKAAWDLARQNIVKAQTRQKKCHDKHAKKA